MRRTEFKKGYVRGDEKRPGYGVGVEMMQYDVGLFRVESTIASCLASRALNSIVRGAASHCKRRPQGQDTRRHRLTSSDLSMD